MPPSPPASRFAALDVIRVLATVWVAWRHYMEQAIRYMHGQGDPRGWIDENELYVRWMFYSGELVIQLFMMVSAFGLTYQALGRESFSFGRWLLSRGRRIYPSLWISLILLLSVDLIAGWFRTGAPLGGMRRSLSDVGWNALGFTGVRWSEPMSGAWWFIGLILSFYLCFPLFLFFARRGLSPILLAVSILVAVYSRESLHPHLVSVFLNPDSDFLGSRMMEFSFGVLLAEVCYRRRLLDKAPPRFSWPVTVLLLVLGYVAASHFALERPLPPFGGTVAFLAFCALFVLFDRVPTRLARGCAALGGPSLLFYLLHQHLLNFYVPLFDGAPPIWVVPVFLLFAVVLGLACIGLQPLVDRLARLVFRK